MAVEALHYFCRQSEKRRSRTKIGPWSRHGGSYACIQKSGLVIYPKYRIREHVDQCLCNWIHIPQMWSNTQSIWICKTDCNSVLRFIEKYCKQRPKVAVDTAPRMKVYSSLPHKVNNINTVIKRRLNLAIRRTYPAASLSYIEKTTPLPVPSRKDSVSTLTTSLCVYQFCCSCGCKYIGRTVRNLFTRIGEHISSWLRSEGTSIPKNCLTKHLHPTGHRVDSEKAFRWSIELETNKRLHLLKLSLFTKGFPIFVRRSKW